MAVVDEPTPGELTSVLDDHVRRAYVESHDLLQPLGQELIQLTDIDRAGAFIKVLYDGHIESN